MDLSPFEFFGYLTVLLIIGWSFRINIYLGIIQVISCMNGLLSLQSDNLADHRPMIWGGLLMTLLACAMFMRHELDAIKSKLIELGNEKWRVQRELIILLLSLLPFYVALTPAILGGGWWGEVESRVDYMSNSSTLLRGIKLTPILFFMLLFRLNGRITVNGIAPLIVLGGIFSLYFGSKSGMIYVVAAYFVYQSLINVSAKGVMIGLIVSMIALMVAGVFMSFLSAESGNSVGEELFARVGSDVVGYLRVFEADYVSGCAHYRIWHPITGTLSKIPGGLFDRPSHLSLGSCLAAPDATDYPFELLIPMFFEYYLYWGVLGAIFGMWGSYKLFRLNGALLDFIGKKFNMPYTALAVRCYLLAILISTFWGGKIGNLFVATGVSLIILFVFLIAMNKTIGSR
jgi:hypothetical protein